MSFKLAACAAAGACAYPSWGRAAAVGSAIGAPQHLGQGQRLHRCHEYRSVSRELTAPPPAFNLVLARLLENAYCRFLVRCCCTVRCLRG